MAYDDVSSKLSDEQEADLLAEAKEHWEDCSNHFETLYRNAKEDWAFLHGQGQWDTGSMDSRSKDGRPSLVLNQLLPYAHQITNNIKQARLAIRVVPIDSKSDVDTAEIRAGIIRNIEKQSGSKEVYGTAAMNGIGAGIGWIRVKIDYSDDDTFEQEACLERVLDFTSIMLDPSDTSIDGSGADFGFATEGLSYTPERFEELYPDKEPSSFYGLEEITEEKTINLAEYYYKEFEKKTLCEIEWVNPVTSQRELQQLYKEDLKRLDEADIYYEKKRSREVEIATVYHCLLSGSEVLSREEFPCHFIPLVPVYGEEYFNQDKREFHSLIRQAKDAQRMYNYLKSENVTIMALQPRAPWTGAVGSFQSYPNKWRDSNAENFAFLEYDIVLDENGIQAPPPQRLPPPQGSAIMMQEAIAARDDIRLGLGIPQSNMGERSNAVSGIAIRNQQIEGDNATFHFIDNLSSSISQAGRILNDIIPALYSERKVMRIIGEEGEEENVPVNTPYVKQDGELRQPREGEEAQGIYDLSVGKYDIEMDVGPSYSSKRQETADKLIEAMSIKPELIDIVGDLLFESLDIPMGRQIAERIKSVMDPAVLEDDPQAAKLQEAAQMMQQMEEQLNNSLAALEDKKKDEKFEQAAKSEELQLDRDKFQVEAEKTKADIDKIYSEIQNGATQDQAVSAINEITVRMDEFHGIIESILDDAEQELVQSDMVTSEPTQIGEQAESET